MKRSLLCASTSFVIPLMIGSGGKQSLPLIEFDCNVQKKPYWLLLLQSFTIFFIISTYLSTDHVQSMPINPFTSPVQISNNGRKWLWW